MTSITSEMLLAFDTSSVACTAALFDGSDACIAHCDEEIGRGHAERLVPMIDELLRGRTVSRILVGVGPGSFTGIRVAIAAAHGLAIGWQAELKGMSSLALLAASVPTGENLAVAINGGHGELFVQEFDGATLMPFTAVVSAPVSVAANSVKSHRVIGSGALQIVDARGWGETVSGSPSACRALRLPHQLRALEPRPFYAREPDARVPQVA